MQITGDTLDNVLTGTTGDDDIEGLGGNDTLRGGAGTNRLFGGPGDDVFILEDGVDLVFELPGEGLDRIAASLSYTLSADADVEVLEALTLATTHALNLIGNDLGQVLTGNDGANVLNGMGGADRLNGGGGNDTLIGGAGADVMSGNAGNDSYFVDDAGDVVQELVGEGTDRVVTSVSFTLGDDVDVEALEPLHLYDTDPIVLTGNRFANSLIGNVGNNVLYGGDGDDRLEGWEGDDVLVGGAGSDTMVGGLGNDTYYFMDLGDRIRELGTPLATSGGIDRVALALSPTQRLANIEIIEALNLTDTTPLKLMGGAGDANTLVGNNGDNVFDGGGGADWLTGAGGADVFVYRDLRVGDGVPTIVDFVSGTDRIALEDMEFGTNLRRGVLTDVSFALNAPQDAGDRVIYNTVTGELLWDPDGTGSSQALLFGRLQGAPTITVADFLIIGTAEYTL
ncbi:MAG: calcium-binding protein [Croceibacterium sp.]